MPCPLSLRCFSLMTAVVLSLQYNQLCAQVPPYSIKVVTDRDNALYEVGEQATFSITVRRGKETVSNKGTLKLVFDDLLNANAFPDPTTSDGPPVV